MLRGLLAPASRASDPPFVSLRDGMDTLVDALADRLERTQVLLGPARRARLTRGSRGFRVELADGEALVGRRRRPRDSRLRDGRAPRGARRASSPRRTRRSRTRRRPSSRSAFSRADVVRRSTATATSFRAPRARDVLACTWSSQKWEGRAPRRLRRSSASTLGASAGATSRRDADDELVALARDELAFLGIVGGADARRASTAGPAGCRSTSSAIPSGSSGSRLRSTAHPGLALAGAAYRGVGIPDCIRSGRGAAESVVRALAGARRVSRETSERLFAEAIGLLPGGVSSPVRAFRAVGGSPLFIERGEGAYLVDVDGNRYVDYVLSWGPLILGHAHPARRRRARGGAARAGRASARRARSSSSSRGSSATRCRASSSSASSARAPRRR